jgi:NhaP-type Na+/H+ or K+/H+ antiporter
MSNQTLFRTGLSLAALLALADLASPVEGPQPLPVVIASMALGVVTIVTLVPAWRRADRVAVLTVVATRIVSALLAIPAFFVGGVSGPVEGIAAAVLALMIVSVVLISTGRRPTPSYVGLNRAQ